MEHPRVPKRKKREKDLCLEVVIWPCFYGLYQFFKVNIVRISIYLSWKKPESKNFAEKSIEREESSITKSTRRKEKV